MANGRIGLSKGWSMILDGEVNYRDSEPVEIVRMVVSGSGSENV